MGILISGIISALTTIYLVSVAYGIIENLMFRKELVELFEKYADEGDYSAIPPSGIETVVYFALVAVPFIPILNTKTMWLSYISDDNVVSRERKILEKKYGKK